MCSKRHSTRPAASSRYVMPFNRQPKVLNLFPNSQKYSVYLRSRQKILLRCSHTTYLLPGNYFHELSEPISRFERRSDGGDAHRLIGQTYCPWQPPLWSCEKPSRPDVA